MNPYHRAGLRNKRQVHQIHFSLLRHAWHPAAEPSEGHLEDPPGGHPAPGPLANQPVRAIGSDPGWEGPRTDGGGEGHGGALTGGAYGGGGVRGVGSPHGVPVTCDEGQRGGGWGGAGWDGGAPDDVGRGGAEGDGAADDVGSCGGELGGASR